MAPITGVRYTLLPALMVLVLGICLLLATTVKGFSPSIFVSPRQNILTPRSRNVAGLRSTTTAASEEEETTVSRSTDQKNDDLDDNIMISWDGLQKMLMASAEQDQETPQADALVTLFRDTNGWCPFCERVWLALEIKQIPYQEQLINLQDKPSWFTRMVPTGLVPAVLFHTDKLKGDNNNRSSNVTERTLIWESLDILKALDEHFPDTPKLVHDDDKDFLKAREMVSKASTAGIRLLYGGRNQTVTEEEKEQKRKDFREALQELDNFLGTKHKLGPFCLGNTVTGVDIEMGPVFERWRYQLPITANMHVYDEAAFPHIYQWFNAMDGYAPYNKRVSGDAYSWTAVASTFLRYFATGPNGTMSEETREKIERADRAAQKLTGSFSTNSLYVESPAAREEAAAKMISNHKAIVADATNADPKSQKEIPRAADTEGADAALRAVAQSLLTGEDPSMEHISNKKEAALAARTVATRLCVPRDMGAPAAQVLRKTLVQLADKLDT